MSGRRHELPLGRLLYEIDRREPPVLEIDPGDEVVVETEDAFTGQIRQPGDRRDKQAMPRSNPVTGPIFVKGARPGDTLRVDIRAIEPLIGQCSTYLWPHDYLQAGLGADPEDQTRICPIENGWIRWSERLTIPYRPMIGVIATAPDWGVPTTGPPGDHGGNLDLKEVGPGAVISLPVSVPGGLLFIGDCHAAQGDGELSGAALEMPARVTLRIDVHEQELLPGPRIETGDEIAAVASAASLESAIATAYGRLALWLEQDYGWNRFEAYSLATQVGRLSVGYFRFGVVAAAIAREHATGGAP
jgi:acetamidase/formamidase